MIAMIGTSDRLCWLAETCKILLLLLHRLVVKLKHAPDEADTSLLLTSSEDGNHVRLQLSQVKLICRFSPQSSASSTLAHHQTPDYQARTSRQLVHVLCCAHPSGTLSAARGDDRHQTPQRLDWLP